MMTYTIEVTHVSQADDADDFMTVVNNVTAASEAEAYEIARSFHESAGRWVTSQVVLGASPATDAEIAAEALADLCEAYEGLQSDSVFCLHMAVYDAAPASGPASCVNHRVADCVCIVAE